ncbi:MAG: TIGR01458 family HAD-type hydrolase [Methanothrix sp.]
MAIDPDNSPYIPPDVKAFLIDLDGVLYVGQNPIPGVKQCLERMDELGYGYRFVSNSTRRCRRSVALRLHGLGYDIPAKKIFTPSLSAIEHMKKHGKESCYLIAKEDLQEDFLGAGICISPDLVDYVVIGDAAEGFTFERLNLALRLILDGAKILALEMDRYWKEPGGMVLSAGPYVAALEYASGEWAELMGKPSPRFFQMALDDLGIRAQYAAMIGDDIFTDVRGAQEMGMRGILVKTGKYREDIAERSGVRPDMVCDSLARLAQKL